MRSSSTWIPVHHGKSLTLWQEMPGGWASPVKKGVLDFVDAANQINVALGEDLGEDAVKNIGKLSQMFGDANRTLRENMLLPVVL